MITTLSSLGHIVTAHDRPTWPFDEHKILHFDNERDVIHMSFGSYEERYTMVLIWIG